MNTISLIFTANKSLTRAVVVAGFIMLTALGAYVRIPIPFTPVPVTLQTFFVILCGAVLGRKLGSFAQVSYVMLGALGMPIFQGYGAGLLHIAGPTGGYLAGFIVAAFLTGMLADRECNVMLTMSAGLLAIYACGIAWLMAGYGFGFAKAVSLGVVPFIPGAVAKLLVASWIYSKIKFRTNEIIR